MNYYILKYSTDTKVIGKVSWGQIELINPINAEDLLDNNEVLEIKCHQNKRSILTDLVSCFQLGIDNNFVISQRLREILESVSIQPHTFSKCTVETLEEDSFNYSVLHFDETLFSVMIDFENSVFRVSETCTFPLTPEDPIVFVKDYSDYIHKKDELFHDGLEIRLERFVLNKEYIGKYDMFTFFPYDSNLYISERLKNELQNSGLSGFDLLEI